MEPGTTERVNPAILEIVELTKHIGGTIIPKDLSREERREFIRRTLQDQYDRSRSLHEPPVNFDLERMKEAVKGPFITLPNGMPRKQRRQFVRDAVHTIPTDNYNVCEIVRGLTYG